jgi:hypothetical protein
MATSDVYRYYRPPRLRLALRIAYVVYGCFAVVAVLGTARDNAHGCANCWSETQAAALFGALLVVAVVWGELVVIKTGLEECQAGFIDHHNFGSRVLRLQDIERFDHRKSGRLERVFAVREHDGKGIPIQGLFQGRRVAWQDGDTDDIVAVLNERLLARRASPPPP